MGYSVEQIDELTGRRIADSNANLEVLAFVRGVHPVVGTIEEIVLAVAFIHLRSPETVEVPLRRVATLIHLAA